MRTFASLGDMLLRKYTTDYMAHMQDLWKRKVLDDLYEFHGKFLHECGPNRESWVLDKDSICPNCFKKFPPIENMKMSLKMKEWESRHLDIDDHTTYHTAGSGAYFPIKNCFGKSEDPDCQEEK